MTLIDDSKSRSTRQQLPEEVVSQLQNEDLITQTRPQNVLLDVFGNVPLKLYDVKLQSIDEITMESWSPQLHLTEEERDIVEAEGTVLVLGKLLIILLLLFSLSFVCPDPFLVPKKAGLARAR